MDLTVRDMTKKRKKIIVHENLPTVPFYMTIVGKSNSGKTNLVVNQIRFYKKIFKKKYIFCFSKTYSQTLSDVKDIRMYNNMYSPDGENRISILMEIQKAIKSSGGKPPQLLLIFDDMISDAELNKRRGIFTELFSMGRHYNMSIILTSQSYTLIPAVIRRMALYSIIYPIYNKKEYETMAVEMQRDKSEEEFDKIYKHCVRKQYGFMYIDMQRDRFICNFDEDVTDKFSS